MHTNIVDFLRDDGIRIDGIGLQSHFTAGSAPSIDAQISNMESFTDIGLEVVRQISPLRVLDMSQELSSLLPEKAYTNSFIGQAITELDIRIEEPVTAENLQTQKSDYSNAVGACVQVGGCVGVTVWDFYDPVCFVFPFLSPTYP